MDDAPIGEDYEGDAYFETDIDEESDVLEVVEATITYWLDDMGRLGKTREDKIDFLNRASARINTLRLKVEIPGMFRQHPTEQ